MRGAPRDSPYFSDSLFGKALLMVKVGDWELAMGTRSLPVIPMVSIACVLTQARGFPGSLWLSIGNESRQHIYKHIHHLFHLGV